MKTNLEKVKDIVYPIVAAILLVSGANAIYAWTAPMAIPPKGNVAAPINVSNAPQVKKGALGVEGNFAVFGNSAFVGKVRIADGTQGNGRVLTSDANGVASWKPLPAKPVVPKAANWVLNCAAGSEKISEGTLSFCGYKLYARGQNVPVFCRGSDELIRVTDIGIGRNHGITKVPPNGCMAWEGTKNYGNQGCELVCKSSGYVNANAN
ncbi:MAG: hypothetical protein FGM57_03815 [Candidatus Taylorbacteria bacterium]|nr:hypothetical protein [Candidatus Taylorbacteria bacterium]